MRYLLRRIGFYLLAAWVAITIGFFLPRFAPGNQADSFIGRLEKNGPLPPQVKQAILDALGVDTKDNLFVQYIHFLQNLAQGHLGISYTEYPLPVTQVIARDMTWTVGLLTVSIIISFILGTLIGIISAWKRGSKFDDIVPVATSFLASVPYFWMAFILVFFLGSKLHWFPYYGGYDPNADVGSWDYNMSVISHAFLPALTLVVSTLAGWLLTMRNTMVTTLSEDYVQLARAKGLSNRRIMLAYAARNAILPNIAGLALSIGFIVGGQIVVELVFSYPGIGYTLVQAVFNNDYPLLQGIFLIITFAVIGANLLADLAYMALDPRIR